MRVRGAGPKTLLTILVSLVRFALHQTDTLTAYSLSVDERYQAWLSAQATAGRPELQPRAAVAAYDEGFSPLLIPVRKGKWLLTHHNQAGYKHHDFARVYLRRFAECSLS